MSPFGPLDEFDGKTGAGLPLLDQRRPMRPLVDAVLGEGPLDAVVTNEAVAGQHEHIARGVGRFVDAVLLGLIAGSPKIHARAICRGADRRRNAPLHPADGVGDGAALLCRAVVAPHTGHEARNLGHVAR